MFRYIFSLFTRYSSGNIRLYKLYMKAEWAARGPAHNEGDARLLRGLHVRLQGRGQHLGALRYGCSAPGPPAPDQWQVRPSPPHVSCLSATLLLCLVFLLLCSCVLSFCYSVAVSCLSATLLLCPAFLLLCCCVLPFCYSVAVFLLLCCCVLSFCYSAPVFLLLCSCVLSFCYSAPVSCLSATFVFNLWECNGSALVSIRIRIPLFTSMRIRIRILVRLCRHSKLNFSWNIYTLSW